MLLRGSITIQDRTRNRKDQNDIAEQQRLVHLDSDGLHIGDSSYKSEVLIDSDSVGVIVDDVVFSSFGVESVTFGNYQMRRAADGGLAFDYVAGGA